MKTSLTLRVPAEAKVTLAGVETKQTGEVRQFATTQAGRRPGLGRLQGRRRNESDGQTVREERTLKLTGGQAQELSVNFDSTANGPGCCPLSLRRWHAARMSAVARIATDFALAPAFARCEGFSFALADFRRCIASIRAEADETD